MGTTLYFRLGGEQRTCSVAEFGWRLGLYTQHETTQNGFLRRLLGGETVRNDLRCATFWLIIGNGGYTSTTGATLIRYPRIRLVHRCITYNLAGRHSSNHRVTASDLFYLYTIFSPDVYYNISFRVASYLKGVWGKRKVISSMGGCL